MRRKFGHLINKIAEKDKKIVLLVGDIGYGIFDEFRKRATPLFHTLEMSDVNYGSDPSALFKRELLIGNDQSLVLYKVTDGSISNILSMDDAKLSLLSVDSISDDIATLVSPDNLSVNLTPMNTDLGLDQYICKEQDKAAIFDFRNLQDIDITGTIEISREANFDTTLGFYKIIDTNGSVVDQITGSIITTDNEDYLKHALDENNKVNFGPGHESSTFYVDDNEDKMFNINVNDHSLIAPFANVISDSGIQKTYFAFGSINGTSHFKVFGDNYLGFEDSEGGGDKDFDDVLLHMKIDNINIT